MYRVHRILPAIAFALCVMLAAASSAEPRFYLCNEATCDACKPVEGATLLDADTLAEVTRKLCAWTDTDLCGWQLELKGLPAGAGAGAPLQIEAFSPPGGTPPLGPVVSNPDPSEASPAGSLSLNWVYDGTSLFEDENTQFLGTLALKGGETHSSLAVSAKSLAVGCDAAGNLKQIAIGPGPLFVPEPPRLLLLAAGLALLAGLAAGRRNSGLAALLLLVIAGGSPAASAEVVAASRALRNADLDLVATSSLGTALAGMGDLNGDGVEDLAVGLPDADGGVGRVQIALLRGDGSVDAVVPVGEGLAGFAGSLLPGSAFGTAVASAGDLNGDGIDELAVAAPGSGRLFVLFLQPGGAVGPPVFVSGSVEIVAVEPVLALAGLGDVDADGVPDLALGHPLWSGAGCPAPGECGAVSILPLHADGNAKAPTLLSAFTSGLPALSSGDHFGAGLAGAGDLDGNGVPDLAVGTPGRDSGQGNVSILFLATSGTTVSSSVLLYDPLQPDFPVPLNPGDAFGSAIAAAGDLDANGSQDLAVGVPGLSGSDEGAVVVLTLTSSGAPIGPGALIDASLVIEPAASEAFTPDGDFGRSLAALDVDGDGDRDVVAGAARDAASVSDEGIAWFLHFADPDGDGRPDAFADNCAGTRNPSQADTDADGVGDACDNCVAFDNGPEAGTCTEGIASLLTDPCTTNDDCDGGAGGGVCSMNQEDADADGVGNVCEGVVVRLKGPSSSAGLKSWDLSIDCGRHRVEELAVALFQPDLSLPLMGSLPLDFSGCGEPTAFTGVVGCPGASLPVGSRVLDSSGVFRSDGSGNFPAQGLAGLRPNTLYALLYGDPLCDPFEADIPVAVAGENFSGAITDLSISASQLDLVAGGEPTALFTDSGPLPRFCVVDEPDDEGAQLALRSASSASTAPRIFLDVSPASDSPGGGVQAWEVCFTSSHFLRRIRLAIEPPDVKSDMETPLFSRADLDWVGCSQSSETNSCSSSYADGSGFRYPVSASASTLFVPPAPSSGADDGRSTRLYPVLSGKRPGFSGAVRLNGLTSASPHANRFHCIGQVWVQGGTSDTADAPIVYLEGETYLDALDSFCVDSSTESNCVVGSSSGTDTAFESFAYASIQQGCTLSDDSDADGVRFESDNCPYVDNPLQRDRGGLNAESPDGRDGVGDACQCGEGDGDGIISSEGSGVGSGLDLQNLREYLVGGSPLDFDARRCGVLDAAGAAASCNVLDAVALRDALETGTLPNRCDAYRLSEASP